MFCRVYANFRDLPPAPEKLESTVEGTDDIIAFREYEEDEEAKILAETADKLGNKPLTADKEDFNEGHGLTDAILRGKLTITQKDIDSLPVDSMKVGLLAKPGTYPVIGRFNTVDKSVKGVADFHRISLKIDLGGDKTMDILMVTYQTATVKGENGFFLRDLHDLSVLGGLGKSLLTAPIGTTRTVARILSSLKRIQAFADATRDVLSFDMEYNSNVAFACGPAAIKWGLSPILPKGDKNRPVKVVPPPERTTMARDHRESTLAYLDTCKDAIKFDLQMLVATHKGCPQGAISVVEEAELNWNEEFCPKFTVGSLEFEPATTEAMEKEFGPKEQWDGIMAFNAWNTLLPDHQPLGSANRLRKAYYGIHRHARFEQFQFYGGVDKTDKLLKLPVPEETGKCPFFH